MKNFRSFFLSLVAVVLLASCASNVIRITAPDNDAEQCLLTPIQLKYVKMPRAERRAYFADAKCRVEMMSEGFHQKKVKLVWESDVDAEEYKVILSTTKDFAAGTCMEYTTKEKSVAVDNLMIAAKYYWGVTGGSHESRVGVFTTADIAPRLMRVPNVYNVRDLGGRIGLDGRRVKQNMVYRTGGLNRNAVPTYYTLDEYVATNENARKIKASVDKTLHELENTTGDLLPALVSREWMVFRPKKNAFSESDLTEIFNIKEIPESIMGGDGVKMTGDAGDNAIRLEPHHEAMPAVFMQYVDAPEDGLVPFQCGADYFWQLAVNNEVIYDMWKGNKKTTGKSNYFMALPVKKGRNLVTVVVGSGSGGFAWHYGPLETKMTRDQVIASIKKVLLGSLDNMRRVIKKDANGKEMFTPGKVVVTEEGRRYMLDVMRIKSEIDLRSDIECLGMTGSPLGDDVVWFHIPSSSYAGMSGGSGRKAFTEVFKVFLDEKNYPIDFHCIAGQDRTGAVAFIINALLGVCEEELYLDWEVTGFWNSSTEFRHDRLFDHLVKVFDNYEGATINERVENYVLSLGFTREDIQHLRDIMLEK
ncbi:MAG: tyrosine-protein phosphatase [Lentisphaeria bacterium]|nr:tyrosine-protein phosphatase [Lentisphaeria bacterium]